MLSDNRVLWCVFARLRLLSIKAEKHKKNAIVKSTQQKKNSDRRKNMNHESRLDMKQDGAQDVSCTTETKKILCGVIDN